MVNSPQFSWFLIIIFLSCCYLNLYAQERTLRPVSMDFRELTINEPFGSDNNDTLKYDRTINNDEYQYIWMPNRWNDKNYSMRFSPIYAPFKLVGVLIALFDIAPPYGPMGTPGMKVTAFYNGTVDDIPNLPTDSIGSVSIPYEDLVFARVGGDTAPVWNWIDLSHLNFNSRDSIDFHIAVDVIAEIHDGASDTLALLADNTRNSERSCVFSGAGRWEKMIDLYSGWGVNFLIRAVISDEVKVVEPVLIGYNSLRLDPAYPNPFNSTTTIRFYTYPNEFYEATLYDPLGKEIFLIKRDVSPGEGFLSINGFGLPNGVYLLCLKTRSEVRWQRLFILK